MPRTAAVRTARDIARQIAAHIAKALLRMQGATVPRSSGALVVAPVHVTAQADAALQHYQPANNTVVPHRPEPQGRATRAPRVQAVGAAKAFVRRDIALVAGDSSQEECTHAWAVSVIRSTLGYGLAELRKQIASLYKEPYKAAA
jgi:ethanolamine utilization microcompartment shell protein EutL